MSVRIKIIADIPKIKYRNKSVWKKNRTLQSIHILIREPSGSANGAPRLEEQPRYDARTDGLSASQPLDYSTPRVRWNVGIVSAAPFREPSVVFSRVRTGFGLEVPNLGRVQIPPRNGLADKATRTAKALFYLTLGVLYEPMQSMLANELAL